MNYENFEVIYTEGYENENGMWCYRISDLKKLPENKNPKQISSEGQNQSEENNEDSETQANTEE